MGALSTFPLVALDKEVILMAAATHDLPLWNGEEKNYSLIRPN
jgi:hypothetical protein